jgi:response regulator receiver domain-containing protein
VQGDDEKSVGDILYVEDDSASGRLMRSIVEREGYRIKVVSSGQEFLKVLGESKPDLVLVDLHLPDASGLDLLAKSRYRYPDVPVIAFPCGGRPLGQISGFFDIRFRAGGAVRASLARQCARTSERNRARAYDLP